MPDFLTEEEKRLLRQLMIQGLRARAVQDAHHFRVMCGRRFNAQGARAIEDALLSVYLSRLETMS